MSDPLPTRKQYQAVREELRQIRIDYKKVVVQKNQAEAKVGQLNKRSEDYLEIYKLLKKQLHVEIKMSRKLCIENKYLTEQLKGNEV